MAKVEREDKPLKLRLDEFERRMFLLKLQYEKYFSGIERIEPVREREDVRRMLHDLLLEPITNGRQRFRFQNLRARHNSLDLYLTRNLVQIERGTHPKMQFRANLLDRRRKEQEERKAAAQRRRESNISPQERQDRAYQQIYETYMEARRRCGQSDDLDFESVKKALQSQIRVIKSRFRVESVTFRVAVEDGKARLKAVPKRS